MSGVYVIFCFAGAIHELPLLAAPFVLLLYQFDPPVLGLTFI